jgi:hypothetical protein
MSQGALLLARNNSEVDYIKQAVFCANRIKKYQGIPVSIITDAADYLEKTYPDHPFDKVINANASGTDTYRKYHDGSWTRKSLQFKNTDRSTAYHLTPYDETILLDTDFIVANDVLNRCFDQDHNLMMYSNNAFEFSGWRDVSEFKFISDTGPQFYWATCVFFRKTAPNQIFFNLVSHISENWHHYRHMYQITSGVFRNDFAFSIAAHIMNGHRDGNFVKPMPGTKYFITDRDYIEEIIDDKFIFLIEKQGTADCFAIQSTGSNVHIMNKFSLNRIIDNAD